MPRCRREDNTKTNLEEIGREDFDWIILAQDGAKWQTHKDKVMNLRVS